MGKNTNYSNEEDINIEEAFLGYTIADLNASFTSDPSPLHRDDHYINKDRMEIYHHNDTKEKKEINAEQPYAFKYQRISRNFVFKVKQTLSNSHGLGLFPYASVLCHARSFNKLDRENKYATIIGSHKEFAEIMNIRYDKEITSLDIPFDERSIVSKNEYLRTLFNMGQAEMIYFDTETPTPNNAFILNVARTKGITGKVSDKMRKREFAAINSHSGYVFIERFSVNKLIDPFNLKFSEADAAIDLWLHIVFNDKKIPFSQECPFVYFGNVRNENSYTDRCYYNLSEKFNNLDKPNYISIRDLADRWFMSVGKVHKLLNKFQKLGLFSYCPVANKGVYIFCPMFAKDIFGLDVSLPSLFSVFSDVYKERAVDFYVREIMRKFKNVKKNLRNFIHKYRFKKTSMPKIKTKRCQIDKYLTWKMSKSAFTIKKISLGFDYVKNPLAKGVPGS